MALENPTCPLCGDELARTEVDIGVGIISGPWGCWSCGWSDSPDYNCSAEWAKGERKIQDGGVVDPLGGWRRIESTARSEDRSVEPNEDFFDGT